MSLQVATEDLGVNRRSHIVMVARVLAIVCRRKLDVDSIGDPGIQFIANFVGDISAS